MPAASNRSATGRTWSTMGCRRSGTTEGRAYVDGLRPSHMKEEWSLPFDPSDARLAASTISSSFHTTRSMAPTKPRATGPSSAINASTPTRVRRAGALSPDRRRRGSTRRPQEDRRRSRSSAAGNGITNGSRCCAAARTYDQPTRAGRSCAVGSPARAAAVLASETKLSPHTPAARTSELECALRPVRPTE